MALAGDVILFLDGQAVALRQQAEQDESRLYPLQVHASRARADAKEVRDKVEAAKVELAASRAPAEAEEKTEDPDLFNPSEKDDNDDIVHPNREVNQYLADHAGDENRDERVRVLRAELVGMKRKGIINDPRWKDEVEQAKAALAAGNDSGEAGSALDVVAEAYERRADTLEQQHREVLTRVEKTRRAVSEIETVLDLTRRGR